MREILISAVRLAAGRLGYAFCSGNKTMIAPQIRTFPAAALTSLKLTDSTGDRDCVDVYRVEIRFMALKGQAETDDVFQILESDALALFRQTSGDARFRRAFGFKCAPDERPITKSGEIAVIAQFNIEISYLKRE